MTPASSMARPPLGELLAEVRDDGSVESWRMLVERLTPQLYRVARGLTAWRVLGAQTAVEQAWRAATRSPDALTDPAMLRRALLRQVIRRASALGDSPRDRTSGSRSDRSAAMRAVTLLPHPARAVLVLADLGGVPIPEIATLLSLQETRTKAELWHARLTVDTLRGAGVGDHEAPAARVPQSAAEQSAADADVLGRAGEGEIAALWREPLPKGLVDRIALDMRGRQLRRLTGRRATSSRITILTLLLATTIAAGGFALWQGLRRAAPGGSPNAPILTPMPSSTLAQKEGMEWWRRNQASHQRIVLPGKDVER